MLKRLDSNAVSVFPRVCARCLTTPSYITVLPRSGLADQPLDIRVTGLEPREPITMAASMDDGKSQFISHAYFKADPSGVVDLRTAKSFGGCYKGLS